MSFRWTPLHSLQDRSYPIISDLWMPTQYGNKRTLELVIDGTTKIVYLPNSFQCPHTSLVGQNLKKVTLDHSSPQEPRFGSTYTLYLEDKYGRYFN